MNRSILRTGTLIGATVALGLTASACASHRFVRDNIAVVDARVDQTEARLGQTETRVARVEDQLTARAVDLGELATRLKSENQNVYLEIQGHTDATGPEEVNVRLGEQRAEAVRRYLSQGGIALNRMSTISYGSESPVAPNDTREGRSQNRRVAIVVLS